MPARALRAGRAQPRLVALAPFLPLVALLVLMGATQVLARDPNGPPEQRFRPATEEMNRGLGLERSDRCGGLWISSQVRQDGDGSQEPACTHGLDLYDPAAAELEALGAYDKLPPFPTPPGIPCYGSGPYVKVLYVYDRNGTSKLSKRKPLIREIVAHSDKVIDDSARSYGARRHVRWLMDSGCNLKVVAVPADLGMDVTSLRFNLVDRGYLKSTEKGLAFTEAGGFGGCSGIAEIYPDDSTSTSNPNNHGAMLALVYSGCWTGGSGVMMGTEVATHELFHTLGAVQWSAPNSTNPNFHCTDESDVMCYEDGSGKPMRQVCAETLPEQLDCGGNDYFHPSPKSGSYLATHWNTAKNRYLTSGSPTAWDKLARPSASITAPSATVVGGKVTFTASASAPSGASIAEVVWAVNGKYAGRDTSSPYTLSLDTFPENGGYANGRNLSVVAYAVDNYYRWKASAAKPVKVANPKVRLMSPGVFDVASGDMPWTAEATASTGQSVTKVELLVNGAVKSSDTTAPYGGTWNARPYSWQVNLSVRVTDSAGIVRAGPPRTIEVGQPVVELLRPSPWAWEAARADESILIAANATAPPGATVRRAQFLVNGSQVGQDSSAPYTFTLDTSAIAAGTTLNVMARVVDSRNHRLTSEVGVVQVAHDTHSATLTAPAGGSSLSGNVALQASVSPAAEAEVWYVAFMANGVEVASAWEAPWEATWDTGWSPNGSYVLSAVAQVSDGSDTILVESSGTTVDVANPMPAVSVSAPTANATVKGAAVSIKANVSLTPGDEVSSVEFYAGNVWLGSDSTAPYGISWNSRTVHDGPMPIRAVAYTNLGEARSAARNVNVVNLRGRVTKPATGATVKGTVTFAGSVTKDSEALVEQVQFLVDGKVVGRDYSSAYSIAWNTAKVANGTHTLKVRVITTDGRTRTSAARTVTVSN